MTTTTQDYALVLKDGAGDYFVLPQGMLERGRVPTEQGPELERILAESNPGEGDDTQGHILPALIIGACWGASAAIVIGYSDIDMPIAQVVQDVVNGYR